MATSKLNQIIAVVTGKKTRGMKVLTEAHRGWNDRALSGISRTYEPKDEDGDRLPSEEGRVQLRTSEVIEQVGEELTDFWNVVYLQELGNQSARAPIVVDDHELTPPLPVGFLLFIHKQLTDLATFVDNLPVLPLDRKWSWDETKNCYASVPTQQARTQKVPHNFVKFEPTDTQPGQSEIIYTDQPVGTWTTTHFSGAVPAQDKADMAKRVRRLLDATKRARETANTYEIEHEDIAETILDHVFG
jgi:hypothetical protein